MDQNTATLDTPNEAAPEGAPENSAEARTSYRYPAQPGTDRGRITIEENTFPMMLLDESAGGFNIAVRSNVQVLTGQMVTIQLPSGWFECEVRRSETHGDENHIGLKRLRGVLPPDDEGQNQKSGPWLTYGNIMQFGAVALGAAILAVLVMQPGVLNWNPDLRMDAGQRTAISTEYSALMPDHQTTRVLEGFNSLTDQNMTKALRLSSDQVKNLDSVYGDASKQLGVLYERVGNKAPGLWQRESALIVQRTLQRVLCVLSDDQVRAWQQMLQKS